MASLVVMVPADIPIAWVELRCVAGDSGHTLRRVTDEVHQRPDIVEWTHVRGAEPRGLVELPQPDDRSFRAGQ